MNSSSHLFWTGITTFGTLTLFGLEVVFTQTANAQTVAQTTAHITTQITAQTTTQTVAQPDSTAAIVQTANDPTTLSQTAELDELEQLTNAAANQAEHPVEESLDNQTQDFDENGDRIENGARNRDRSDREAIEESEALNLDALRLDRSDTKKQPTAAGTENAPFFCQENCSTSIVQFTSANQFRSIDVSESLTEASLAEAFATAQSLAPESPAPDTSSDTPNPSPAPTEEPIAQGGSALLGAPFVQLQGAVVVQGDEFSARARTTTSYAISPNVLVGGTLDLVTGNAFTDSPESGLNLNELYVAVSPSEIPTLRFVVGLLDYTSYFDRNSFAKDGVTQFFNPIFQTNPALTAAGLSSRPGLLVNWTVTDNLELRAAGFSSRRNLGDFALDGFAAEAAVRVQNLILRGTFLTAVDAGDDSGFREIFQFDRGSGDFGLRSGDREQTYGINAEYFVPSIRLGLFARYGWYDNLTLNRGGETYSFGFNLLDLFLRDDRLGLAYGRDLSNDRLRRQRGDDLPDVVELFYDARLLPNLRAGITAQARNGFSETILGFRLRADLTLSDLGRAFR